MLLARERDLQHIVHGVLVHTINSLAMFVQLLVVKHPLDIWHFIYPTITLIIYFATTIIYFFLGGLNLDGEPFIYPVLKWGERNIMASTVAFGLIVLSILFHVFACYIQNQREKWHKKWYYEVLKDVENYDCEFK